MPVTILMAWALAFAAQADRRPLDDVLKEHAPDLRVMDGVIDVSVGGTAEEPRIVIRVASDEAKASVKAKVGASIGGYKVFFYVSAPAGQTVVTPKPPAEEKKPPAPKTEPEPEKPVLEDCDIMRDHLKIKPVLRRNKENRVIDPCQLMRRQRLGGGGGHSFWYTKHRTDCPLRQGKLAKPKDADDFTNWVFTRGFQPAKQGSFLVFELKGSDKLWFEQVKEDLTSLLPYIREGAQWTTAKTEDAGAGWKWEVPK